MAIPGKSLAVSMGTAILLKNDSSAASILLAGQTKNNDFDIRH